MPIRPELFHSEPAYVKKNRDEGILTWGLVSQPPDPSCVIAGRPMYGRDEGILA